MRRSFGGGSYGLGRNPGGGSGGFNGGGMMRTVGRVLRTRINGLQDPFPSSSSQTSPTKKSSSSTKSRNNVTSKHALTISSPTSNDKNCVAFPVSAAWSSCPYLVDGSGSIDGEVIDGEWEYLEDYYDPVFGGVPSTDEVQHALFSLHQVLHPPPSSRSTSEEAPDDSQKELDQMSTASSLQRASSVGSGDWIEPTMRPYDQRLTPYGGWDTVYDAFHLLQTEPAVQKMVVSLSSDKAVWDAVLNNETVREIRDSYLNEASPRSPIDNSDPSDKGSNVLMWILDCMKGKLLEAIGNITQFVGDIFKPLDPDLAEEPNVFTDRLKSSVLLTIVVLLIVVVTRGSKP